MRSPRTQEIAELIRRADKEHPEGGKAWGQYLYQIAIGAGWWDMGAEDGRCTCQGHDADMGHDPLCGLMIPEESDRNPEPLYTCGSVLHGRD